MTSRRISSLTDSQLVECFRGGALDYKRYVSPGTANSREAGKAVKALQGAKAELQKRGKDSFRLLYVLLSDPDPGVRNWAASSLLGEFPQEAERVLVANVASDGPGSHSAQMILDEWRAGRLPGD